MSSWMRAIKEFKHTDSKGREQVIKPGQLVDVINRHVSDKLLRDGIVVPKHYSHSQVAMGELAPPHMKTKRVGLWINTSRHYSGGRLHMYQYALCLARAGAEVFLITNGQPRWADDYKNHERLHVVIHGQDPVPPDLDVVFTDSKTEFGRMAHRWAQDHQHCPLVAFNFETPNWVAEFCPEYARQLDGCALKEVFHQARVVGANSRESLKWCMEWLGVEKPTFVLPPAVNEDALKIADVNIDMPRRPFAMWVSRSPVYKGGHVAQQAVWALGRECDLVTMGHLGDTLPDTEKHKLWVMNGLPDAIKYTLMRRAAVVLAPSLFEGFGMVPAESLASGTPCIVYELPVLRQEYGDRLIYAKWGDRDDLKQKLSSVMSGEKPDGADSQAWATRTLGLGAMQERIEKIPYHACKRKAISAHMICYGTQTACEALESVYPHVEEIVIAYGRVEQAGDWPENGMLERLRAFPDPEGKIRIEARKVWQDKRIMREWAVRQCTGNYQMMLDADEIWVGLDKWLASDAPQTDWGCPRWVNLWHGGGHWIHDHSKNLGRRWGFKLDPQGSVCPHYRYSWWRTSYYFLKHPYPVDMNGVALCSIESNQQAAEAEPGCMVYHLGHSLPPGEMTAKHAFYERRDGADPGRVARRRAWHDWDGTAGLTEDGIISEVDWELPDIVKRALGRLGHEA